MFTNENMEINYLTRGMGGLIYTLKLKDKGKYETNNLIIKVIPIREYDDMTKKSIRQYHDDQLIRVGTLDDPLMYMSLEEDVVSEYKNNLDIYKKSKLLIDGPLCMKPYELLHHKEIPENMIEILRNKFDEDVNRRLKTSKIIPMVKYFDSMKKFDIIIMEHDLDYISLKTMDEEQVNSLEYDILYKLFVLVFECGYIHGDLNCGNVLMDTKTGNIKFIDFGDTKKFDYNKCIGVDKKKCLDDYDDFYHLIFRIILVQNKLICGHTYDFDLDRKARVDILLRSIRRKRKENIKKLIKRNEIQSKDQSKYHPNILSMLVIDYNNVKSKSSRRTKRERPKSEPRKRITSMKSRKNISN